MVEAFMDLVLAYLFGAGSDPRPSTNYYVRLLDTTGTEISAGAWTDYAPVAIARNGGFGSPGAGAGGRRQVASSADVEFSEAAQVPGGSVTVRYVVLATADTGGTEVLRYQLPQDKIIQNGDPVVIPAGQLIAFLQAAA